MIEGRRPWPHSLAIALALPALLLLGFPGAARASLTWSAPSPIDRTQSGRLQGVACPSPSQCTAVDGDGQQVTFNPSSPGNPTPTVIDAGNQMLAVACPSSSQCTAGGASGHAVTFNPSSPGNPTVTTVDSIPGAALLSVACPTTSQCTAIDNALHEVTFNPTAPGGASSVEIGTIGGLQSVACPSSSQCTAVDTAGQQFTFNPNSPGTVNPTSINGTAELDAVACPTTTRCTAISGNGEVTFDPTSGSVVGGGLLESPGSLVSLACPTVTQCTAIDFDGFELTFNPAAPSPNPTRVRIASPSGPGTALYDVDCPTSAQCTAVDPVGREISFNPTSPGTPTPVVVDSTSGTPMSDVACPTRSRCAAIDDLGLEVTFDPVSRTASKPVALDSGRLVRAVDCPTSTQCTAVGARLEVTFDPGSPGSPTPITIDPTGGLAAVACPSARQCTAVDGSGHEVTFDPISPGTPAPAAVGTGGLRDAACTSTAQCTAVGGGQAATFDPGAPGTPTVVTIPVGRIGSLVAVACPSAAQCTALVDLGAEATFNPTSTATPAPIPLNVSSELNSLACPATNQCTAVDDSGQAVSFNPTSPGTPAPITIFTDHRLPAVACPASDQCTAVSDDGYQLTGGQAPTITAVGPSDGARGVSPATQPYAVFDEPMSQVATAGAFSLVRSSDHQAVAGHVVFFGDRVPVFQPDAPLQPATQYTATVSTGAEASDGAALASPKSWAFTTRASDQTSTTLNCFPGSVAPRDPVTCKATVTDNAPGSSPTPTGRVSFASSESGRFSPSSCALSGSGASSSCTVQFEPLARGRQGISATYSGDVGHQASAGQTIVDVAFPASKKGCDVYGFGRITAAGGDPAGFLSFAAAGLRFGIEVYQEGGPDNPISVRSLSVDSVTCSPDATAARVFGVAKVSGSTTVEYRLDFARSGAGSTYRIRLSSGYDSGVQPVSGGVFIRD